MHMALVTSVKEAMMTFDAVPDLSGLDYDPQNFRDVFETDLGQAIWAFLKRPENLVRMETATYLDRTAVEPLGPGLLRMFGPEIAEDRLKQMIGHMARQIMEAMGFELDRTGMRITRESMFTTAAKYKDRSGTRDRTMRITPEQRRAWLEKTAASPFNRWLDSQVKNSDGSLDLDRLYKVASSFGIENQYRHLNPGQQRMTIGLMLRKKVPPSDYRAA
jgi:hypothetical protein